MGEAQTRPRRHGLGIWVALGIVAVPLMSVADAMAMVAGRVGAAVLLLALIMSDAVALLVAWRRVDAQ